MPTRFEPLRDDGIDAMRLQPQRFVDSRGSGQDSGAPASRPVQQFGGRQAEMEAHDRGFELLQHVRGFGTEGQAPGSCGNGACIDPVLVEKW